MSGSTCSVPQDKTSLSVDGFVHLFPEANMLFCLSRGRFAAHTYLPVLAASEANYRSQLHTSNVENKVLALH